MKDVLLRVKISAEGKDQAVAAIKSLGGSIKDTSETAKKGKSILEDYREAFRRAFIVAPVWMLARQGLQEMINFVRDGIKYYLDTEKAVINLRASLMTMGDVGEIAITKIENSLTSLSLQTGQAIPALVNMMAEAQRIMQNPKIAEEITRKAAELGEATGTKPEASASALAFLYKAQASAIGEAAKSQISLAEASAMLYQAQSMVPGGLVKLDAELMSNISTMKLANLSIEDYIKLTVAMNQSGITMSSSLKTGLMKILMDLPKAQREFGIQLGSNATPLQVFTAVMERLGGIMKSGDWEKQGSAIKEIFSIRAGQIGAMAKDVELFQNIMGKPMGGPTAIYQQEKQLRDVNETMSQRLEVMGAEISHMGEEFAKYIFSGKSIGAFGGIGALIAMGNRMWDQAKASNKVADLHDRIQLGMKGELSVEQLSVTLEEVKAGKLGKTVAMQKELIGVLEKQIEKQKNGTKEEEKKNEEKQKGLFLGLQEAKQVDDLVLKYAKASTPEEKAKAKKQMSLMFMKPEQQLGLFEKGGPEIRSMIEELLPKLNETAQNLIRGRMAYEAGMGKEVYGAYGYQPGLIESGKTYAQEAEYNRVKRENEYYVRSLGIPGIGVGGKIGDEVTHGMGGAGVSINGTSIKASDIINIIINNTNADATTDEMMNAIKTNLNSDEDWLKIFGKKLLGKVPYGGK